jgi:hypothetical protein
MLTVFSKVMEKVMDCRLNQHLQVNNILVQEQFGFMKNLSTVLHTNLNRHKKSSRSYIKKG